MAQAYVDDDKRLLAGKAEVIERIELWWDSQGIPDWFLVTKLPLFDKRRRVQGVMGTLRRPDEAERRLPVFQTVALAVEIIRRDFSKPLLIEDVAKSCGQSLRQRLWHHAAGVSAQDTCVSGGAAAGGDQPDRQRDRAAVRLCGCEQLHAAFPQAHGGIACGVSAATRLKWSAPVLGEALCKLSVFRLPNGIKKPES
jgi:hypothetical protein